jgi:hypothetical protein
MILEGRKNENENENEKGACHPGRERAMRGSGVVWCYCSHLVVWRTRAQQVQPSRRAAYHSGSIPLLLHVDAATSRLNIYTLFTRNQQRLVGRPTQPGTALPSLTGGRILSRAARGAKHSLDGGTSDHGRTSR